MKTKQATSTTLGITLKAHFKKHQLTQADVSLKTGIPTNSLNRKLNGGVFDFEELVKISDALHEPLAEIMRDAESAQNQGLTA